MQKIQRLEATDFCAVRDFYWNMIDKMKAVSAYGPGWKKGIYPSDELLRDALQNQELYAYKRDDQIIGAMILNHKCNEGYAGTKWNIDAEEREVTVIHTLGVTPDCQRQSVAESMVQYAVQLAKENQQKAIRLDVLNGNLPAEKLYEKLGFTFHRKVQMFYADTGWTDYLIYELVIGGTL